MSHGSQNGQNPVPAVLNPHSEDELAWSIFVDIYCLEDDGNTNDAALLSTIKSLQNLELPTVEFSETGNEKKVDTEKKKKALQDE